MAINGIRIWRFAVRPVGAEPQQPAHEPVDAARDRREIDHLFRHGRQRGIRDRRAGAARQHFRVHRHHHQRQHHHRRRQYRAAVAVEHHRAGAERCGHRRRRPSTAPDRPSRSRMPRTELSSMVGILNTQAGDRFMFSGSAINTPSVASADDILNGTGTQAGLKQVIAERAQADRHHRPRPSGDHARRRADLGVGRRGCRRLAVRPEAEFGVVVADAARR